MKKLILNWLFGTDNVKQYIDVLYENMQHTKKCMGLIDEHIKSLGRHQKTLETTLKLIEICKNHGIDVDEELKKID